MPEYLDMTLDDIIKRNKSQANKHVDLGGRGSGRGHGWRRGRFHGFGAGPCRPTRHFSERDHSTRMMPYFVQPGVRMRGMGRVEGVSNGNPGTVLHVSNLSHDVTHEDIKILFSDVGDLKRYTIHFDGRGRPKGTAEVVFERESDALAAFRRYNNRCLDGMPMKVAFAESDILISGSPQASHYVKTRGVSYGRRDALKPVQGHLQKRCQHEKPSAQDLDADLEKYHDEARRI